MSNVWVIVMENDKDAKKYNKWHGSNNNYDDNDAVVMKLFSIMMQGYDDIGISCTKMLFSDTGKRM